MGRSKAHMTHAKRDRERARLEKRARKLDKKEARKLAAPDAAESPQTPPQADADVDVGFRRTGES